MNANKRIGLNPVVMESHWILRWVGWRVVAMMRPHAFADS